MKGLLIILFIMASLGVAAFVLTLTKKCKCDDKKGLETQAVPFACAYCDRTGPDPCAKGSDCYNCCAAFCKKNHPNEDPEQCNNNCCFGN